jgi:hypothetical protein
MKRMLFAVSLLVALSTASFSSEFVAGGKTQSTLGDYRIETADHPVIINGEELKAYIISYENSPLKVTVAVRKDKDCKSYIVLSDLVSVQYVCNAQYFGVQRLDKNLKVENAAYNASDEYLNTTEYFHQKVITPGKQTEIESAQFIAAYFPMLIKEEMLAAR